MTDAELLADVRDKLLELTPELDTYVVNSSIFDGLPRKAEEVYGWAEANCFVDPNVVERIPGFTIPKPIIALNLEQIREAATPGAYERCVLNVGIHEGGHCLPARQMWLADDTPCVRAIFDKRMKTTWETPAPEPGEPYDVHGEWFVRATTHLLFRALVAGFDVTTHQLYGPYLWMRTAEVFLTCLIPECVRMQHATFAEIKATEPPWLFTAEWQSSLALYQKHYRSREEK